MTRALTILAVVLEFALAACAERVHEPLSAASENHTPTVAALFQHVGYVSGGALTRAALDDIVKHAFDAFDADHDHRLDRAEGRQANVHLLKDYLASPAIDWDNDGFISFVEFTAQWHTAFENADTNRDGVLDARELAQPIVRPRHPNRSHAPLQGEKGEGLPSL